MSYVSTSDVCHKIDMYVSISFISKKKMPQSPQLIGIRRDGTPLRWTPPPGIDPALPYESLMVGASVYAWTGDGTKAEAAAIAHYYSAQALDINSFIK
jgi:hypothetical protein